MSDLYWLSDAQMAKLEPFFPKSHGKPRVDVRHVLSELVFIDRNGLRWRDAPEVYGPHKTLYSRWKRPLSHMLRMCCRSMGARKASSHGCYLSCQVRAAGQTRS